MSSTTVTLIMFVVLSGAALLGVSICNALHSSQLDESSRAPTTSSLNQVRKLTADVVLLDLLVRTCTLLFEQAT